jgi:hypothetical protein
MAMGSYIRYFWVETLESKSHFRRYLPSQLDISVWLQEQSHHQIFCMGQMNQIILVVVIHSVDLRIRFSLPYPSSTLFKLLWAWLIALMSIEVACTNFSLSLGGTHWQIRIPSLSDSTIPLRQWNSSTTFFKNSVLSPPIININSCYSIIRN